MTKIKKRGTTASATRHRRQKLFNQYFDKARETYVKLSYSDVSKIDNNRGKKSFKAAYNDFIQTKLDNKQNYIRSYYKLDKQQAGEVLSIHLAEQIPIKAATEVITGMITRSMEVKAFYEFVSETRQTELFLFGGDTIINFPQLKFKGTIDEFMRDVPLFREELEETLADAVDYPVTEAVNVSFTEFGNGKRGKNVSVRFSNSALDGYFK